MYKLLFIALLSIIPFLDINALILLSIVLLIYIIASPCYSIYKDKFQNVENLENINNSTENDKNNVLLSKIKTKKIDNPNLEEKIIISNMGLEKNNYKEENDKNLDIIESLIIENDEIISAEEKLFNSKTKRDYDMFDMQANATKTSGINFRRQIKQI